MTIAGVPSVAELRDLVAAKDYEQAQLTAAYASYSPVWVAKDGVGFANWTNDWDAMKQRYASARAMAERWLTGWEHTLTPTPDTLTPAPVPWNAVVTSLQKVPGTTSPGDMQDLYNRFIAAGGTVTFPNEPQPTPGTDADLNLLNKLGGAPTTSADCNGFCIPGIGGDCILCIPKWIPIAIGIAMIFAFFGPAIAYTLVPLFLASRK